MEYLGQRAILGELAWGIFHEFNNHLQIVLGFMQDICDNPMPGEQQQQDMNLVLDEIKNCCRLLKNIKFLRMSSDSQGYEDLEVALDNILPLLHYKLHKKSLKWQKQMAPGLDLAHGEPGKIRSAIVVLLAAAIERSLEKTTFFISCNTCRDQILMEVKFTPSSEPASGWRMEEYLKLLDYSFALRNEDVFQVYSLQFASSRTVEEKA